MTGLVPRAISEPKWYDEKMLAGIDHAQPGIYEWRIDGIGVYIGQYTNVTRPRRAYGVSVANRLAGRPYRKGNPSGFRAIHIALAKAVCCNRIEPGKIGITLTILENQIDKESRNRRERALIAERRREAQKGGLPVLNSN
jgi:hypothetical protein